MIEKRRRMKEVECEWKSRVTGREMDV